MSGLLSKASKGRLQASKKAGKSGTKKVKKVAPKSLPKRPKVAAASKPAPTAGKIKKTSAPAKKAAPVKKKAIVKKVSKPAPVKAAKKSVAKASRPKPVAASKKKVITKPVAPKRVPTPNAVIAVRAFEQALKAFNKHDFATAKSAFESLLEKFPEQMEIAARVRTYLAICAQRLAASPTVPRNPDALYNRGIIEFNKGNVEEAITLFDKALKADSQGDHILYSLAAAHARASDDAKALDTLRRAILLQPVHRSHARNDLDFASLRSNEAFQQLTGFGLDMGEE